ncbi:MAG: hypothetical protein R3F29_14365 [Planctomycetota bacterium]
MSDPDTDGILDFGEPTSRWSPTGPPLLCILDAMRQDGEQGACEDLERRRSARSTRNSPTFVGYRTPASTPSSASRIARRRRSTCANGGGSATTTAASSAACPSVACLAGRPSTAEQTREQHEEDLLAALLTAPLAAQQAIDLGGGCIRRSSSPRRDQHDGVAGDAGAVRHNELRRADAGIVPIASSFWPGYLILLGFTDPNAALPSCGCLVHTSAEVLAFMGFHLPPPSAGGHVIYAQGIWFNAYGVPRGRLHRGTVLGAGATNGYRLLIP